MNIKKFTKALFSILKKQDLIIFRRLKFNDWWNFGFKQEPAQRKDKI